MEVKKGCGFLRFDQSFSAVWGSCNSDLLLQRSCTISGSSGCEKNRAIPVSLSHLLYASANNTSKPLLLFSHPVIRLECGAHTQSVERVLAPLGGAWPFCSTLFTTTLTSPPLVILMPGDLLSTPPAPAPPPPPPPATPPPFKHQQQVNVASMPWRKRLCMKQ